MKNKLIATGVLGVVSVLGLSACGDDITKNYVSDPSAIVDGDTLTITEVVKNYDTLTSTEVVKKYDTLTVTEVVKKRDTVTVKEILKTLDTLKTTIVLTDTVLKTDTLTSTVLVRDTIRDTIKVEIVPEAPIEELVYGTVDLSYAQFYYGDINDVAPEFTASKGSYTVATPSADEYDVYTSATNSKGPSYKQSIFSTDAADIKVEGAKSAFLGIKAANVAINKALLEDVKKNGSENDKSDLYKLVSAANWEESAAEPKTYKVINSDGTLSKTQGKVALRSTSDAELVQNSSFGHYQVNLPGYLLNEASTDNIQGIIVETDAGEKYALRGLANIWLDVREFAFSVEPLTLGHGGGQAIYAPFVGVDGKFLKKVTYLLKDEASVEIETDIYLPLNSKIVTGKGNITETPGRGGTINYSVDGFEQTSEFTVGETIVFQVDKVARSASLKLIAYALGKTSTPVENGGKFSSSSKNVVFNTADLEPGTYTFKFEDASGIQLAKNVSVTIVAAPETPK